MLHRVAAWRPGWKWQEGPYHSLSHRIKSVRPILLLAPVPVRVQVPMGEASWMIGQGGRSMPDSSDNHLM